MAGTMLQGRKDRARLLRALLRNSFPAFTEKVFYTLNPSQTFVPGWAHEALCSALMRIQKGQTRRQIINLPPRSLKSITTSVAFVAWLLGHDPTLRIICVSYSADLARKHANDFRTIVESDWYRNLFPGTRISPYKNSETEVAFEGGGFRLATSIGGTLTGRGGNLIIIDDPLKPDDALSDTKREAANAWFYNTLLSRLDNKMTGAIIVVMQRVHMNDLTGFLLDSGSEWDHLCLPAIAEAEARIPLMNGKFHHRMPGDVLDPNRESLQILESMKRLLGADAFYAQYQQMPVPPGGMMVKRDWVRRYEAVPDRDQVAFVIQSWDTASKGGPQNDWSVCTTWFVTKDLKWHLIDLWRGRVDYPALRAKATELARQWKPIKILIEDAGTGTGLAQELNNLVYGVVAVKPLRDKISRMAVASAVFQAGQVLLPQSAPWLADLESELFSFPGGKHDDQCDSISQALNDEDIKNLEVWVKLAS